MKKLALGLAAASLMTAGSVEAQFVTGGGSFSELTAADLNNNDSPFWDNRSSDGQFCNIGYILLGQVDAGNCINKTSATGAFGILAGGGEYYSDGGMETPFVFSGASRFRVTVLNAVAGLTSEIGFFTGGPGTYAFTNFGTDSKAAVGGSSVLATGPGGIFGLYITASRLNDGCNSDTACSDADGIVLLQQHALFRSTTTGRYYVGMEDRNNFEGEAGSDRDFNDVILEITPVPEPMSMALLATGLLGLGGVNVMRRRRNKVDA